MDLDREYAKIPLKCMHQKCLFEVVECSSKVYWDWLQENRVKCPKCCPKYKRQ